MTIKTVYIAIDGTEFTDEHECQEYEIELSSETIYGITYFGKKISFREQYFPDIVHTINLPTSDAVNLFCAAATADDVTIDGIEGPGIYTINPVYGWERIDIVIDDYESEIEQLKKYKDMLLQ